jgi:hypothetical protein
MMRVSIIFMALALALASCSKPAIECTRDGMIIIPEDIDNKTSSDWNQRNLDLALARLADTAGTYQGMREHLVKAQGCP